MTSQLAWITNPNNLLLLDFVGALATSIYTGLLLTAVLPTGFPTWILLALAIIASGFADVDMIGYCLCTDASRPLALISVLNLLYCMATIAICIAYMSLINSTGRIYFALECAIVIPLAITELVIATQLRHKER